MKKYNTKTLITITLICGLTALSACTNKYKQQQAAFKKNVEDRAEGRMSTVRFELDADGDGVLTCTDSDLLKIRLMDRFDANKDQKLSSDEYKEVRLSHRRFVYFDFDMVDKNQDNSISPMEFIAIPNDKLKSFDLDKNCKISDDELKKGIIASILQNGDNANPRRQKQNTRSREDHRKGKGGRRGQRGNINPL